MIRNILYILTIAAMLWSCSGKLPGPCDCEGQPTGDVCREVLYNQGKYAGYINYTYNSLGQLEQLDYHTPRSLVKTLQFTYSPSGRVIKETIVLPGVGDDAYRDYQYDAMDSLITERYIENGTTVSQTEYTYSDDKRLSTKSTFERGALSKVVRYSYFQNGNIWKVQEEDASGALMKESHYNHYQNLVLVIDHYDQNMVYQGYDMIQYFSPGKVLLMKYYDDQKNLREYLLNEYNGDRLSRSARYDGQGRLQQQTHFLYYE